MYILVIRNHQDSAWLRFVYTRDFILVYGQTLFTEFTNEIETDKDAFETITIQGFQREIKIAFLKTLLICLNDSTCFR